MIWFRYHWPELAAVTAPTVAAVTVSRWFGVLTVLTAIQWARQEWTQRPPPAPAGHGSTEDREDQSA